MISVIICSADNGRIEKVKANIAATIGVPYEILVITNAKELGHVRAAEKLKGRSGLTSG